MNRYAALGCLGLGLMVSPLLGGIGSFAIGAVPASSKIAVVDVQSILDTTPAGKRAKEQFEKTFKAKQAALSKEDEEFQKAQADLIKQKSVLKPEVFEAKRQELEKKIVSVQETYVKLERELNVDKAKLTQEVFEQARPKLALIAKAEGVTVVIDKAEAFYVDPAVDLTDKLKAEMK